MKKHLRDQAAIIVMKDTLTKFSPGWEDKIPLDDQLSRVRLEAACAKTFDLTHGNRFEDMQIAIAEAETDALSKTAWRLECTLREFKKPAPINCWFDYPVHRIDDTGILADMEAEDALPAWRKGAKRSQAKRTAKKETKTEQFITAFDAQSLGGPPTLKQIA